MDVDVSVTREADGLLVKLSTYDWEFNVWASPAEIARLRDIRSADWMARRSIAAGRSAGESAFWAHKDGQATLFIGHDEETWDIALMIPVEVVDEIVNEAERDT